MNNFQIEFHPLAKKELLKSRNWYLNSSEKVTLNFQLEFRIIILLLQENPFIFPVIYDSKRRANMNKFPFSIIFSIVDDRILIYSVFHQSRNPKIWRKR